MMRRRVVVITSCHMTLVVNYFDEFQTLEYLGIQLPSCSMKYGRQRTIYTHCGLSNDVAFKGGWFAKSAPCEFTLLNSK